MVDEAEEDPDDDPDDPKAGMAAEPEEDVPLPPPVVW